MIRSTCFVFGEKIRPNTKGGIQSGNKMKSGNMACQWFQIKLTTMATMGFCTFHPAEFPVATSWQPFLATRFFTMHPGLTRKLEIKVGEEVTDIQTLGEG